MDAAIAAIIGAAVGAGVAGLFSAMSIWITHRSDDRRQVRDLAFKAAFENWAHFRDRCVGADKPIPPLDMFVAHASRLILILDGKARTDDEIRRHIESANDAGRVASVVVRQYADTRKDT